METQKNHGKKTLQQFILEGELTLITPNGREVLKPGAVRWLPPNTPHESRNEGATPVKMWALLLKRCN